MNKYKISLPNKREIYVDEGTEIYKIVKENDMQSDLPIVLANFNGKVHELTHKVTHDGTLDIIDTSTSVGNAAYVRTLQFLLVRSVLELFPDAKVTLEHSISRALFGEIHKKEPLGIDDVEAIEQKMHEIAEKDIPIHKVQMKREDVIKIFSEYKMYDKVRFLNYIKTENLKLYELDGIYDYFYGFMAYSTGVLKNFKLNYYEPGFILRFPIETNPYVIPRFVDYKKLSKIFYETEKWGNIMGIGDVGSLNDKVENGDIVNIIRVAEALHEKKIAYISDMICDRSKAKIVLIAGPTSSGKTTFAKRLGIQLRVNGKMPIPISLDDYFVDRDRTPKDKDGNYDFESIYALDLELFNKNLQDLLDGKEVEMPTFDFKLGHRVWSGEKFMLPENGILVIEGIHGLNEMLSSSIPKENKFKIYISALTQLNLDDHNRIATTDVRMIRRIVRDYLSRGCGGERTLKMWDSVKRGEEKNIFVFQEQADVMFNSTLIYELCVLKKYALKELEKIKEDSSVYYEAQRLKGFLNFFKDVDMEVVPENSILREFIGGSCFYKY